MELREGYKQTEVGVIPEEWEVKRLDEAFKFLPTGNNTRSELSNNGDVKYIHYGDIHTKWSLFLDCQRDDIPYIASEKVRNLPSLEDGDLVMADASEDYSGIGATIEIKNTKNVRVVAGLHTILLRGDKDILVDGFKAYLFSIKTVHDALVRVATGVSVYGISKTSIKDIPIPIPPHSEQHAIAAALSDVDALIGKLDALIAKKRDIKQGAMQELLTGKRRLAGFGGEWQTKTIGEIFEFLPTGNNTRSQLTNNGDVKYIHYGDIHTKWSLFLDCQRDDIPHIDRDSVKNLPSLEDGDLVMADASEDYTGIGAAVEIKNTDDTRVVAGLHTIFLRGDKAVLADGYKAYLFSIKSVHDAAIKKATGVSVYGITKNNLIDIALPIPPLIEQHTIAEVLSDMHAEIEALEQQRAKYQAIKQGMMQELLTGRVRLVTP